VRRYALLPLAVAGPLVRSARAVRLAAGLAAGLALVLREGLER
jgi:hypothetical protein